MSQQYAKKSLYLRFAFAAWLLLPAVVFAQMDQGRIVGTVRDLNKGVLPGVSVVVKNERTEDERTTITTDQGYYVVTALKPSFYTVRANLTQFAPAELTHVQVFVGRETRLDLVLRPEGISQTITVQNQEALTDNSSARIGADVNGREVEGLPINGHQLSQLYLQAPGASNGGTGTFDDIRFSGRSNEQNAIRYDGIEGTGIIDTSPGNLNGEVNSPFRLQTSLESVQEFRIESNSYPAEYGTGTGGQISVISKSGSNQFHGSLFEYLRNDSFDARNFFDLSKPSKLRLNQFGGSVGGPIIKDKFFFFFGYEGYRLRAGINSIEAVPSLATRARAVRPYSP